MPRGPRLIMENACYHVIARGNEKKTIFKCDSDYEKYAQLLLKYKKKFNFKLYAWCIMHNHSHMVIESDSLSKVLHAINMSYAQYYRYKYESTGQGHLWQDRFKSYIIQKDKYLINCITYIEHNPIRSEIVSSPEDYKWCSYRARVLGEKSNLLDFIEL